MSDQHDQQSQDQEQPATMTLMGVSGQEGQIPGLENEGKEKTSQSLLTHSGIIIALVAVVGVSALAFMRATQKDPLAENGVSSEVQQKVETYIGQAEQNAAGEQASAGDGDSMDQMPGQFAGFAAGTDTILATFSRDLSEHQVPVHYVKKNPFQMRMNEGEAQARKDETDRQQRREALQRRVEQLQLQSVMGGQRPVAMIGGDMRQAGDTVGPFTIESISDLQVTLSAEGHTFTLSMSDK
jgi:hypothetical protein